MMLNVSVTMKSMMIHIQPVYEIEAHFVTTIQTYLLREQLLNRAQ